MLSQLYTLVFCQDWFKRMIIISAQKYSRENSMIMITTETTIIKFLWPIDWEMADLLIWIGLNLNILIFFAGMQMVASGHQFLHQNMIQESIFLVLSGCLNSAVFLDIEVIPSLQKKSTNACPGLENQSLWNAKHVIPKLKQKLDRRFQLRNIGWRGCFA